MKFIRVFVKAFVELFENYLRLIFVFSFTLCVKVLRYFSKHKHHRTALIIPASSVGSLGDEAMLSVTLSRLKEFDYDRIFVALYKSSDKKYFQGKNVEILDLSDYFQSSTQFKGVYSYLLSLYQFDVVVLNGADVLDGKYSEMNSLKRLNLMWFAAWSGAYSSILGFSWNSNLVSQQLKKRLIRVSRCVDLHTRDIESTTRIKKLTRKLPKQVADLAFLFPKSFLDWNSDEIKWIQWSRKNSRIPIVANLNSNRAATVFSTTPLEFWTQVLSQFLKKESKIDILFVPHDYRPGNDDTKFMQQVIDNFEVCLRERVCIAKDHLNPQKVKFLCENVEFVLTGRMHLGIAALSSGVPCVFVDYQGKVEGLLKLFKISEMILTKLFLQEPNRAAIFLIEKFKKRRTIAKTIVQQFPHVHNLAMKNFDNFIVK